MQKERLMRIQEVESTIGVKKSKIYTMVKDGSFPAPIKIAPRIVRWKSSAVQEWIASLGGDRT